MAQHPRTKKPSFRLRLCVSIAPQFQEMSDVLQVKLAGFDVTIKSKNGGAPSGTDWVVFETSGFPTQASARHYGERLRMIVQLAGACAGPGVDTGKDRLTSWLNPDFLSATGILKVGQRLVPDVHGLSVFPDDGRNLAAYMGGATGIVETNPRLFVAALRKLSEQEIVIDDTYLPASIRLLNLIRMSQHPIMRFLLSIIAIEPLGESSRWTVIERGCLKELVKKVETDTALCETTRTRIAKSIRRSISNGPTGLKEGVSCLIERLGREDMVDEWKQLYDERSALVHGRKQFDVDECGRLADRATKLATTVVQEMLRQKGISLP